MHKKMKAWVVRNWCKPEEMEFATVPVPEPGDGQILVRVEAAALNFLDTLMIQGLYQVKPPLPFTPGMSWQERSSRREPAPSSRRVTA